MNPLLPQNVQSAARFFAPGRARALARCAALLGALGWAAFGGCEFAAAQQSGSSGGLFGSRSVGGGTLSGGSRSLSGASAGLDQQSQVGQVSGNERFVRDARQPGQFVGADTRDTTNLFSALAGQNSQLRQLQRTQQAPNPNQQLNSGANQGAGANRQRLKVQLTLGFEAPRAGGPVAAQRLADRMARLPGITLQGPLEIALHSGEATLKGTVATERDRELVERLALLEPGVDRVRNELAVAP